MSRIRMTSSASCPKALLAAFFLVAANMSSVFVAAEHDNSTDAADSIYQASGIIRAFRNVPRLSPEVTFLDIFQSQQDYLLSVSLIAIILLAVVAFWLLLLLTFKILGQNRLCECAADIGLSGEDVQKPSLIALHNAHPLAAALRYEESMGDMETSIDTRSTDTTSQIMNQKQALWVEKVELIEKRVRNVRISAIFFGLLLLVSSGLMVMFGLNALNDVSQTIQRTATNMGDAFSQAAGLSEAFVSKGVLLKRYRDELIEMLNGICPSCDDSGEVLVNDGDLKTVPVVYIANSFIRPMAALGDFGLPKILNVREALATLSAGFYNVADSFANNSWFYPTALVLISLMDVCCLVFLCGILFAWSEVSSDRFQSIQSYILMPLFVLLVVASVVFCSLFSIFTVVDADFCGGVGDKVSSPDNTILSILNAKTLPSDAAYTAVSHFTQNCHAEDDPLQPLLQLDANLEGIKAANAKFQESLTQYEGASISNAMGLQIEDYFTTLVYSKELNDSIIDLQQDMLNITGALECSALNQAYQQVTYDGVCTQGATSLVWLFSTLGLVAVSGMALITLRSSFRRIVDYDDKMGEMMDHNVDGNVEIVEEQVYDDGVYYEEDPYQNEGEAEFADRRREFLRRWQSKSI